jgi:hypothetical protein
MTLRVGDLAMRATRSIALCAAKLNLVDIKLSTVWAFFIAIAEPPGDGSRALCCAFEWHGFSLSVPAHDG